MSPPPPKKFLDFQLLPPCVRFVNEGLMVYTCRSICIFDHILRKREEGLGEMGVCEMRRRRREGGLGELGACSVTV